MTAAMEAEKARTADVLSECFGEGGNFTVVVEERRGPDGEVERTQFKVWSVLLTKWSKVFDTMINSQTFAEASEAQVVIKDFSARAVEAFLRFLYSGVVEGSLQLLVEVGAAADKYQVETLQDLCARAIRKGLTPAVACDVFKVADAFRVQEVRAQALEQILIHPRDALKVRPQLSPELLEEILDSPLLCVEDSDLAQILQGWGKRTASQEGAEDELHPLIESRTANLKRRRVGEHSTNILKSLAYRYDSAGTSPHNNPNPFLGTWVTMTLSPGLKPWFDHCRTEQDKMNVILGCARGVNTLRMSDGWAIFMFPQHYVYLTGFSFDQTLTSQVHFEISCSKDGVTWHHALTSKETELKAGTQLACIKPPHTVKWFKLHVRAGEFASNFRIHGILQTD